MPNPIPHFKYHPARVATKKAPCIEVEREIIHTIEYPDEFYKAFGYAPNMGKAGVLPDEFIWSEYIQNSKSDFSACIQIHIMEYLIKHSGTFIEKYGIKCAAWLDSHAVEKCATGKRCAICKLEPFREI